MIKFAFAELQSFCALGRDEVAGGAAFGECVVYDYVAVGHCGYYAHFVAYKDYCGGWRDVGYYTVDVFLEMFVEIAQRFVKHKNLRS